MHCRPVRLLLLPLLLLSISCSKPPAPGAKWAWVGAVTDTSAVLVAEAVSPDLIPTARLTVTTPDGTSRDFRPDPLATAPGSPAHLTPSAARLRFTLDRLTPATEYTYRLAFTGQAPTPLPQVGSFRTFTQPGRPTGFTFALGSCMQTDTTSPVFTTIAKYKPLFMLFTGDLHYEDIGENRVAVFESALARQLSSPPVAKLLETTPVVYVWDDHDFGPNDSDSASPSREASAIAYRSSVPHYPLQDGTAIYQAFTLGRVRFVLADLRSERIRPTTRPQRGTDETPGAVGTMVSDRQLQWLKTELLESSRTHAVVFFVSTVPWIDSGTSRDSWNGYRTQRRQLSEFLRDNRVTNLAILSGDAHMLALDDGTNSSFTSPPSPPGPVVFHAAALDQTPSNKGGPYSHGSFPERHQFGLVNIQDNGQQILITFLGLNANDKEILRYQWSPSPPR
jgi:hypothetical protein